MKLYDLKLKLESILHDLGNLDVCLDSGSTLKNLDLYVLEKSNSKHVVVIARRDDAKTGVDADETN